MREKVDAHPVFSLTGEKKDKLTVVVVLATDNKEIIIRTTHTAALPQNNANVIQKAPRLSKRAQRSKQLTTITSYAAVLALIASVVSVGYQSPVQEQVNSQAAGSVIEIEKPSVDQIVAANLAASTAEVADLSIATNAANLSISLNAKENLAQNDDNLLSKPQIVQPTSQRGIITYKTVAGDNVQTVASRFGIKPDTVKWANNLATDALSTDTNLTIPSTDGVVYTVKDGDTTASLASKYGTDAARIVSYNDLEVSGLKPGIRIVIPGGIVPENERPKLIVPRATTSSGPSNSVRTSASTAVVGNKYDYGYCTWYVYNRRAQVGAPVGSFWGNAVTWASYARSSGYLVNNTPSVGAVLQNGGGYGHVAFVESVGADGSVTVSEMNYVGWNVVSSRTISAGQASSYNYIH